MLKAVQGRMPVWRTLAKKGRCEYNVNTLIVAKWIKNEQKTGFFTS